MPAGVKGRMELGMGCIAWLILPCHATHGANGMDNHDETTLQGNMKKRDTQNATLGVPPLNPPIQKQQEHNIHNYHPH